MKRNDLGSIEVDGNYQSSLKGLYVISPLNTQGDQVSVAVGEGAKTAMKIISELRKKL